MAFSRFSAAVEPASVNPASLVGPSSICSSDPERSARVSACIWPTGHGDPSAIMPELQP